MTVQTEPFAVGTARFAPGLLREFNDAGVLSPADVHVALRLASLGSDGDELVGLAAALAVRAPRLGHVYVDLATIASTAAVDTEEPVDLSLLSWPDVSEWTERLAGSALVAVGDDSPFARPLRLVDTRLYLDRYWRDERQVTADLQAFSAEPASGVDVSALTSGVARVFGNEGDNAQRLAAASAVLRRLAVVAGGPGTGKTTTVARIVALIAEQAMALGLPQPLVALAAPTGKAAARLEESVHREAADLAVDDGVRDQLMSLSASTLHRLLGWNPDSHSRFRHNRSNRLPHDLVIVDETSMVSLSLMARLVEAVRPDARLVLVGDPGQLTSIEAGAVLGDIVGPVTDGLRMRPEAAAALADASGVPVAATEPPAGVSIGDGIVVLDRVHRFGEGIAALATAVRRGDADAAIEVLQSGSEDIIWIPVDVADPDTGDALAPVRECAVKAGRAVQTAADAGDASSALKALETFRVLCAHRRGDHGVARWTGAIEEWLTDSVPTFTADGRWYVGRPLLLAENDYGLRLYNGDIGVVVRSGADRVSAAFERRAEVVEFSPNRLGAVETAYAMTIHKSQGSQFGTAAVLLPPPSSRILTRELLYTAITRAQHRLFLLGTEESARTAVARPVARASGLGWRLWGAEPRNAPPMR
jgi:exodeoxyribonuclease V alpha subunit